MTISFSRHLLTPVFFVSSAFHSIEFVAVLFSPERKAIWPGICHRVQFRTAYLVPLYFLTKAAGQTVGKKYNAFVRVE